MNPSDYKIMVIDSDEESAHTMLDYFRACGFRVTGAKTASAVLKKILQETPSLLIIDLMQPRRDGLKVCRDLSHNYATRHIPIIMVASEVDVSDKIVALELGVDDYVKKPFNLHELTLRIERSLDRAAARA